MTKEHVPGFRPDFANDLRPVGITDTYEPGRDKPVQLTLDHMMSVVPVVAAPGMGGLSVDGEYSPISGGEDFTIQQHLDRVNERQLFEDIE